MTVVSFVVLAEDEFPERVLETCEQSILMINE